MHPSVELGYAFDLSDRPAVAYARVGLTSMLGNTGGCIDMDLGRNLSLSLQGQTAPVQERH